MEVMKLCYKLKVKNKIWSQSIDEWLTSLKKIEKGRKKIGKEGGAVEVKVGSAIHPKSIWTLDSVSLWRTLHSNTITASDPNLKPLPSRREQTLLFLFLF
ncbi:hypothetical protein Ahy_B06g081183 isoform B [Arachis hypogaea]|uniref:Uncharacterized protein n=1 Tax=Arachis hypogaea TaxID=3818 RepID=A0A444YKF7_ARAHY|nr:hypothetical protein Ahy_B06g081183 isoform B [Arachis hypogaea]